ncbi:WD40-repeat-containing domain protein [Suillus variegatus]|nr:WD40-repeat-containing domain protein [Suillus variegatus]
MSPEFLATPIIEEAMTSDSEVPATPAPEEVQDPTQTEKSAPKQEFVGHEDYVWAFVFLHDNIHIVSGSWDGTMRKWDCDTGLLVGQPWTGKGGCIHALALSPDGKTVACGRMDGSVQRWNTDSGKMIEDVWTGHSREVRSLSWSPNGDHIASGSRDGTILIRKLDSGQTEMGPIKTGQRWVNVLVYSPSGDKIASGGLNETICIWDTKTGELVIGPIEELGASVTSLLWSSKSKKVYAASDKFVRVFDSNSGIELHRFEHNDLVNSIALSPKHNVLACVGQPGVAQLWDTESYEPLLRQPFIDRQTLRCISFSRDGRYLASSGLDKKLTLWVVKDMVPELTVRVCTPILQVNKLYSRKLNPSHQHHLASMSMLQILNQGAMCSPTTSRILHTVIAFRLTSPIILRHHLQDPIVVPGITTYPPLSASGILLLSLLDATCQQMSLPRCNHVPSTVSLHNTLARSP